MVKSNVEKCRNPQQKNTKGYGTSHGSIESWKGKNHGSVANTTADASITIR